MEDPSDILEEIARLIWKVEINEDLAHRIMHHIPNHFISTYFDKYLD